MILKLKYRVLFSESVDYWIRENQSWISQSNSEFRIPIHEYRAVLLQNIGLEYKNANEKTNMSPKFYFADAKKYGFEFCNSFPIWGAEI